MQLIYFEYGHGRATRLGAADQNDSNSLKVSMPMLSSGMKTGNDAAGARIAATQIWSFLQVATVTTPATIVYGVRTTMLLCDDVFYVK